MRPLGLLQRVLTKTCSESNLDFGVSHKFDSTLFALSGITCVAFVATVAIENNWQYYLHITPDLIGDLFLFHVIFILYISMRRIQTLESLTEKGYNVCSTMKLRRMLNYIFEFNASCSLQLAIWVIKDMILFVWSLSLYWVVYGLHSEFDCTEYHHPLLSFISESRGMFKSLVLAFISSKIQNCVSKVVVI